MGTGKEIKRLRLKARLSAEKAAAMIGVDADRLRKWESKDLEPRADDAKKIEAFFGVTLDNLAQVENFQNVPHETPRQRHIKTREYLKEEGESKNGIHVYESAPVYASMKTVYHDEHAVPDYVLNIPQFRDCNYGTRASGDSMYPEIRNGDLVVCKELSLDARIIFGDIYVIHTKDGIETIKYVQQFTDGTEGEPWVLLVPHNKSAGMGTPIPRSEIIKIFKVRAIFKAY